MSQPAPVDRQDPEATKSPDNLQPSTVGDAQVTGPFPGPAGQEDLPLPAIEGYEIHGVLGRGGMGIVYKAHHHALKRDVALKMVLAGGRTDPGQLARFRAEVEAVARLQHPNIV